MPTTRPAARAEPRAASRGCLAGWWVPSHAAEPTPRGTARGRTRSQAPWIQVSGPWGCDATGRPSPKPWEGSGLTASHEEPWNAVMEGPGQKPPTPSALMSAVSRVSPGQEKPWKWDFPLLFAISGKRYQKKTTAASRRANTRLTARWTHSKPSASGCLWRNAEPRAWKGRTGKDRTGKDRTGKSNP